MKNEVNVPSKSNKHEYFKKNFNLLASWRSLTKIAEYGSESGSESGSRSITQRHGSAPKCHGSATLGIIIISYPDRAGESLLLHNVDNVGDDSCSLQLLLTGQRLHPCLNTSYQSWGSGFIESENGSGSIPDPGFWRPKTEDKNTAEIFFFFFFYEKKIAIYLSLGLHKGPPSYRRSLQPWILFNFFLCLWVILPSWFRIRIVNLDPDTDQGTPLNPDPRDCMKHIFFSNQIFESSASFARDFMIPKTVRLGI
jgi:hypothetical protein